YRWCSRDRRRGTERRSHDIDDVVLIAIAVAHGCRRLIYDLGISRWGVGREELPVQHRSTWRYGAEAHFGHSEVWPTVGWVDQRPTRPRYRSRGHRPSSERAGGRTIAHLILKRGIEYGEVLA